MKSRELLVFALVLAGCANILGIEDPEPRPDDPGVGGSGGMHNQTAGAGAGGPGEAGAGGDAATKTECAAGEMKCNGNIPQTCKDGAWADGTVCASYCLGGACRNPPSCSSQVACSGSTSCCRAIQVPGGTFIRDFDDVNSFDDRYKATLSSFLLDQFEVTVGRMRRFVDAYPTITIEPGDGKAPHIVEDEGWRTAYQRPTTAADLKAVLNCPNTTWTDDGTGDELLPVNCVNFFVAYAFCIWDGGRLPTEAEWNYAAAGGDEQRVYPWSVPASDPTITDEHAVFLGEEPASPGKVGSKPRGNGRWGHADLAGNVYEWTLDYYVQQYQSEQCNDCLVATGTGLRSIRGGSYGFPVGDLLVTMRSNLLDTESRHYAGFRCVRDLPPTFH